ncbi:MAG: hypothetical protein AB7O91_09965 [Sphingomonas sp.]
MADDVQYWDGYRLNPDGTIQFSAIVDYGILTVPSGAIFQFNHAASQQHLDEGRLESIQLHLAADKLRECGEELLRIADRLGA